MKWRIRRGHRGLLPWVVAGWIRDGDSTDWVQIKAHVQSHAAAIELMDYYERRPATSIVLGPAYVGEAPC